MTPVHRQQVRTHAYAPPCLNLHALGEQWIGEVSDVDIVQNPPEDSHEGDQLIFKAHIRGWETEVRQIRCQSLKGKSDLALRQALLRPRWKDILLIPQHWYPADSPKFETEGWWYAPAEEVLGRTCKSCRTFYEIENSAGAKRSRRRNVRCPKCQSENDQAKATGERGTQKNTQRKKTARALDTSNLRRSERMRGQERVCYHGSSSDSDSLDSDDAGALSRSLVVLPREGGGWWLSTPTWRPIGELNPVRAVGPSPRCETTNIPLQLAASQLGGKETPKNSRNDGASPSQVPGAVLCKQHPH